MPFRLNGRMVQEVFYDRKSIARAYLAGKCVFVKPDKNKYLMVDRETEVMFSAGKYALAYSNTPYRVTLKDWAAKEWTLAFVYEPERLSGQSLLLDIPGAFSLSAHPGQGRGLEFRQAGTARVRWVDTGAFKAGENLVEISRKDKQTCLFINGAAYVLPLINLGLAAGRVKVLADRSLVRAVSLAAGASKNPWPEITEINTCSNLVPEDITEGDLKGFTVTSTNTESGPLLAFNPTLNPSYPRWQAYGIWGSFTLELPAGKSGAVLKYTVTQWTDTGSERVVTGWTLQGSMDGREWKHIHSVTADPWDGQTQNGAVRTFTPKDQTDYRFLRLTITAARGSSYCSMGQIRFYTADPEGTEVVE